MRAPIIGARRQITDDDRQRLYRVTRCTLCNGPLWLPSTVPGTRGNFVSPDGITHNACLEMASAYAAAGFPV